MHTETATTRLQENVPFFDAETPKISEVHTVPGHLGRIKEQLGRSVLHDGDVTGAFHLLVRAIEKGHDHAVGLVRIRASEIIQEDKTEAENSLAITASERSKMPPPSYAVESVKNSLLAMYGLKPDSSSRDVMLARETTTLKPTFESILRGQGVKRSEEIVQGVKDTWENFGSDEETLGSDAAISRELALALDSKLDGILRSLETELEDKNDTSVASRNTRVAGKVLKLVGASKSLSRTGRKIKAIELATDEAIAIFAEMQTSDVDDVAKKLLDRGGYKELKDINDENVEKAEQSLKRITTSSYSILQSALLFVQTPLFKKSLETFSYACRDAGGRREPIDLAVFGNDLQREVLDRLDELQVDKGFTRKQAVKRLHREFHPDVSGKANAEVAISFLNTVLSPSDEDPDFI